MFNNQLVVGVLHPFILYALFGTLVGYLLVRSIIVVFRVEEPRLKIKLLFIPIFMPFLALLIRKVTARVCLVQLSLIHKQMITLFTFVCNVGNFLSYIFLPPFIIAMVLAVVKGIGSFVACHKLADKYGYATKEDYPELLASLENISKKAEVSTPALIITGQKVTRSFTFGLKKPVIVLTQGILDYLDLEEIETVLAHELAHVVRGDSLMNWVAVFLRDLLFFAPAMFFIFRDIVEEKEKASDDITLELTDKHMAFGEALIKVWKLSPKTIIGNLAFDNFSSQPNFIKHNGILEARLQRILNPDYVKKSGFKTFILLASTVILTVSAFLYFVC